MRAIFFNIWDGKIKDRLINFIKSESSKTDVFCFQEIKEHLYKDVASTLVGFEGNRITKPAQGDWTFDQAIFCKQRLEYKFIEGDILQDGTGQGVKVEVNGKEILICNIQGVAMPGSKLDTDERIAQSKQLVNFISEFSVPKIIGGDFNLMPETTSIKMIEGAGLVNLIQKYSIKETRNKLAWEYYKDTPGFEVQHYSDYVFASQDIKINKFEVPNIEASDHEPLILDFEI